MFLQQDPIRIVLFAVALLSALTFHEFSHAIVADWLGDKTARLAGRVTLNPLAHLDPAGTLMIVLAALIGFGIGWGKPVPVNPFRMRTTPRTGMAIVAAAGPASNIVQAAIGALLLRSSLASDDIANQLLLVIILVNVSLAVFNMIPIAPLDGFRVLVGVLPGQPANLLAKLAPYGPGLLILLVFLGQGILGSYLNWASRPILRLMLGL